MVKARTGHLVIKANVGKQKPKEEKMSLNTRTVLPKGSI